MDAELKKMFEANKAFQDSVQEGLQLTAESLIGQQQMIDLLSKRVDVLQQTIDTIIKKLS